MSWLGAVAGALWLISGVVVALNYFLWGSEPCIGRTGIYVGLAAVAVTVCNGQRKREGEVRAALERQAARAEFGSKLTARIGPQRVN